LAGVGEFLSRPATGIWLATPEERPAKPKIENRFLKRAWRDQGAAVFVSSQFTGCAAALTFQIIS
jgi:hypothetical protein